MPVERAVLPGTIAEGRPTRGLDPRESVKTVHNPVQHPGRHRIISATIVPDPDGPNAGADRRLYVDVETANLIADMASASRTNNAVLRGVSLRVELREDSDGNRYEVWKFSAQSVRPERSLVDEIADK